MKYTKLADSDLEVSEIAFGAWAAGGWMWGSTDRNEAVKAIQTAYSEGVTTIDTAPIYGQGASEEIVGEAVKSFPRDKVQILTKFGMRWDLAKGDFAMQSKDNSGKDIEVYKYAGKESVIYECEQSLKRLKTDYIDLFQIHWPESTTPIEETFEAVSRLIEQGKVRYAGVCNYNVEEMEAANEVCKIISNQVPYSMVKRKIEEEVIPYCLVQGKSILAYSPMERGLLTGKLKPGHQFAEGDHRKDNKYFTDEFIVKTNDFLQKIKPIADEYNATLNQLVLNWTVNRPGITVALAGARNAQQALSNAKALNFQLSDEEMEAITEELEKMEESI